MGEDIHGHIDPGPVFMGIDHGLFHPGPVKISGFGPEAESAAAQIDSIGTVMNGSLQFGKGPGRGQKLRDSDHRSFFFIHGKVHFKD